MSMLNGNNVDAIRQDAIVDDVRKSPHGTGTNLAVKDGPSFRILLHAVELVEKC